MRIVAIRQLSDDQKEAAMNLWNQEYPIKLKLNSINDLDNYLSGLRNVKHFILLNDDNKMEGWSFLFERTNENWFAIIVNSKIHRQGFGRMLLNNLKENSVELNGWVIDHDDDKKFNGENYKSPLQFYLKNEFIELPEIRLETDEIKAVKIKYKK